MFDPCQGLRITAYLQTAIDRARGNDFSILCYGRHIKYSQTLFAALMMSSDRRVLALCSGGSLGSLPYSLTILMSRCNDGTILITHDNLGIAELDQFTDARSLPRGFDRLLNNHLHRLNARIGPVQFPRDADWRCVNDIYHAKTDRIVQRGWHYIEPAHDYIRLTPWGSFYATILHGMKIIHRPISLVHRAVARTA